MVAYDFPTSGLVPNVTTHTIGERTWIWKGTAWEVSSAVPNLFVPDDEVTITTAAGMRTLTPSVKDSLSQATENKAGTAAIASQETVNAGLDHTQIVTSKTLNTRLAAGVLFSSVDIVDKVTPLPTGSMYLVYED